MARFDGKVEVTLSATDRQLLRDIRDALRPADTSAGDEASKDNTVRLTEQGKWDHRFLDDHYDADAEGYAWDSAGWVPKG
jgi:hypothetical protein